jgi:2-polyprenyl-6-methoxyphenol hydroxylase-like FAD-dependent oxidoreductase
MDQAGNVLLDPHDDGTGERPEAPRGELRQMLLDSLPAGTVRRGRKVTAVRPVGDGRHQVHFADSTDAVADLLIGADGAWSRVRPLLSTAAPEYFGVCSVETLLFDAETLHRASAEAVGAGSLFALAPGRGPLTHREGGGTLHTYAQLKKPHDWFTDLNTTDAAALTSRVAREFDGWAPALTALISDSNTPPALRPIFTLPAGHRWDRVPGVTLLGDPPTCGHRTVKAPTWPCWTVPNSAEPSPRTPTMRRPRSQCTNKPCSPATPLWKRTTTASPRS